MTYKITKLAFFGLIAMSLAMLLASCGGQEEPTPTSEPMSEPTHAPEASLTEAATAEPTTIPEPAEEPTHAQASPTESATAEPTTIPAPAEEPTGTAEPLVLGEPLVEFSVDSTEIEAGECTILRWQTENVVAVYVHPIFAVYNRYPVENQGSLELCPPETIPYSLRADLADGSFKAKSITIFVTEGEEPESQ